MKKILHLICNSHIDPVWQWDWDEGASAALSTFYAACNLLDKYDFIFCHNEVLLYEYIEKYDPELFLRIQNLVKAGKWKIMGGWYCQPDCLIPSGESLLRQISLGREYFQDKFGARPTTALNFDSFGHTKGLPQILKKSGFDSYIFCRPLLDYVSIPHFIDYPHGPFLWEGYDGTRIKALRYEDKNYNYTTELGRAKEGIIKKAEQYQDLDIIPVLWGVGNHGGLSSEKDLEDIIELQNEKTGQWQLIHSTPEDYFASVNPTKIEKRFIFVFSKSYSSASAIKQAHDRLENALYRTERVCSIADLCDKRHYNKQVFKEAERTLCQIEFHDVLAGTAIKKGIDSSIRKADYAIEMLNDEFFAAYYSLAKELKAAYPGDENNVFINSHPFDYDDYVECEIYPNTVLTELNTCYQIGLYDINDNPIEYQIIKEDSNINKQHRVRLLFKAHVPAFSVAAYRSHIEIIKEQNVTLTNQSYFIKDNVKEVVIDRNSGLLKSFKINNVEYLSSDASVPMFFDDNADPWGWRLYDLTSSTFSEKGWPLEKHRNTLKSMKVKNVDDVKIVESGELLKEIQSVFYKGNSRLVVNYRIYKNTPYIDVNYHIIWGEHSNGLKIKFPINGDSGYMAQMAFGIEKYKADGVEYPSNRYIAVKNNDNVFAIYNNSGIHSVSKKGKNLYLTLLNGSSWCAHPLGPDDYLLNPNRTDFSIEEGTHDFSIRIGVNKINELEKIASVFNIPVYNTLFYPHGDGKIRKDVISIDNQNIIVTALKKRADDSYLIRLYNGSFNSDKATINILNHKKNVKFAKFEFKTFVFDGKTISEVDDASIY